MRFSCWTIISLSFVLPNGRILPLSVFYLPVFWWSIAGFLSVLLFFTYSFMFTTKQVDWMERKRVETWPESATKRVCSFSTVFFFSVSCAAVLSRYTTPAPFFSSLREGWWPFEARQKTTGAFNVLKWTWKLTKIEIVFSLSLLNREEEGRRGGKWPFHRI